MILMNRKIINRTVDIAMALCPLNLEHRCSHIAFLIRCGKIVHIGTNSCKSHPETLKSKPFDLMQSGSRLLKHVNG